MLTFLGIGAQKCGTTWLYNALSGQEGVSFPGGKEIHFWDRPNGRSLCWYSQLFSDASRANGEITPAYSMLPVEVIRNIHDVFPKVQLLYLIRNPIERAWSSARMALSRAEMTHEDASDQWFIDHFKSKGSLARGDYETCIRRWRSIFGSEPLKVVRYEAIVNDPAGVLKACMAHLGLVCHVNGQDDQKLAQPVFKGDGVPLRPSLLKELLEIYGNRISSLSQYLDEDFSSWNGQD